MGKPVTPVIAAAFDFVRRAPPQETISSEIGRHESNPVDEEAADVLDAIQKDHVENAVQHANKLDAADNGKEK